MIKIWSNVLLGTDAVHSHFESNCKGSKHEFNEISYYSHEKKSDAS